MPKRISGNIEYEFCVNQILKKHGGSLADWNAAKHLIPVLEGQDFSVELIEETVLKMKAYYQSKVVSISRARSKRRGAA